MARRRAAQKTDFAVFLRHIPVENNIDFHTGTIPPAQKCFCIFRVSKNAVFRIPPLKKAPKCRPSAIRGAPNSRIVSAPRAPFGAPKTHPAHGSNFSQKRIRAACCDFGRAFDVCVARARSSSPRALVVGGGEPNPHPTHTQTELPSVRGECHWG